MLFTLKLLFTLQIRAVNSDNADRAGVIFLFFMGGVMRFGLVLVRLGFRGLRVGFCCLLKGVFFEIFSDVLKRMKSIYQKLSMNIASDQ